MAAVVGVQAARMYLNALPDPVLARLAAEPVVPFGQSNAGEPLPTNHPLFAQAAGDATDAGANADAPATGDERTVAGAPAAAPAQPARGGAAAPVTSTAASAPTEPGPLALRQGCAWGDPGRDPYRGTVEEALSRARLPADVIRQIVTKVRAGVADDRVEITNAAIRTVHDPREFDPKSVAMTFGRTLCVNTRVNFEPGHMERADYYEATDAAGNTYAVMVPYVCGNVSVLGERAERDDEAPVATLVNGQTVTRKSTRRLPAALAAATGSQRLTGSSGGGPGGSAGTRSTREGTVPEPGTWTSMLTGLALMGWFVRRRRTRSDAQAVSPPAEERDQ
jgi:hypothetical protein